ncbi:hypothetical protein ACYOEI_42910, partial [Singulisphaera rosea]
GMGGGMGGMGGGGFRSVPPSSLPTALLKPKQTRHLPTVIASLNGPNEANQATMPAKGEKLRVGDIDRTNGDPRTKAAMKKLADEKAPQAIAQLVLWNVASGLDWAEIAKDSREWANGEELTLARQFVERLDADSESTSKDAGLIYWDVTTVGKTQGDTLAGEVRDLLSKHGMLGLTGKKGIPDKPEGPALAIRAEFDDRKVEIQVRSSDADGTAWKKLESFTVKRPEAGDAKAVAGNATE